MKFILLAASALLPVAAHDLYLMPECFRCGTAPVPVAVHTGDSFPDSEEAVDPARLTAFGGFRPFKVEGRKTVSGVQLPHTGSFSLGVRTDERPIELKPAEFEQYLRSQGLTDALKYRRENKERGKPGREIYQKFAKAVVQYGTPDGAWQRPIGHLLEFLPEDDPLNQKPGASVVFKLLLRGTPVADVQVELSWAGRGSHWQRIVGRTDQDGRVKMKLEKPGWYRVHSIHMERLTNDANAEWRSLWASMTFDVRD